jgi:hypothetical protein
MTTEVIAQYPIEATYFYEVTVALLTAIARVTLLVVALRQSQAMQVKRSRRAHAGQCR